MAGHLSIVFKYVEHIKDPGTLDGGDVMQVENHFYIGVSKRTNHEGADQFMTIVTSYVYTASKIEHPIHGGGPQNLDNVLSSESTLKERS